MLPDIIYGLPNATSCFKAVSMLDLKLLNVAMWATGNCTQREQVETVGKPLMITAAVNKFNSYTKTVLLC